MTSTGTSEELGAQHVRLVGHRRFMITGAVLALAVLIDSLARRSRASHGRA
jgi:D-xylose transport system permease protein